MGIIRGGDAEYEDPTPSFEQKQQQLEAAIESELKKDPAVLKLTGRYLATDEMTILSQSAQVQSVKSLDLSDNQINDEGLKILFESANLSGLESLNLDINFLTDEGMLAIAKSPDLAIKNLKVLTLSDNKLTDASLAEWVHCKHFDRLERLDAGWNQIGNGTAKALAETEALNNLRVLELERSYIDAEGIAEFVKGRVAGQLQELNLTANKLNDEAVQMLAGAPGLGGLKILRLSQNQIGDAGARALGESTHLTGLTNLYLGRNYFGPEGAKAVYETRTLTQLKVLMLQEGVETTPGLVNYSRPELLRPEDP